MTFHVLSFRYFQKSFGAFFALQLLIVVQSFAPFACLLSSFCKFSIIGLISGFKFSLLYTFSYLSYFSLKVVIFSWVVGIFRKYLRIHFKKGFGVFPPVTCWKEVVVSKPCPEGSYKIGSVCPSFRLRYVFLGLAHWFLMKLSIILGAHI